MAPCWKAFGLSFRSFSETISRTGRFGKIRTAPTRELCFRCSSLSKSIHVGLYFWFRLRLRVRSSPEPPFGAIYVDSVPKMRNFRSPPVATGLPNGSQKGTQESKRAKNESQLGTRRGLPFRLCSERDPDRLLGMVFAFVLAYFLLPSALVLEPSGPPAGFPRVPGPQQMFQLSSAHRATILHARPTATLQPKGPAGPKIHRLPLRTSSGILYKII